MNEVEVRIVLTADQSLALLVGLSMLLSDDNSTQHLHSEELLALSGVRSQVRTAVRARDAAERG